MDDQEQAGPSGRGGGPEYTRGGVKKLKFAPTVPTRRSKKAEPAAPGAPVDAAASHEAFAGLLAAAEAAGEQAGRGRGRGGWQGRPVIVPVAAADAGPAAPGSGGGKSSARLGSLAAGSSRAGGLAKAGGLGGKVPKLPGLGASSSRALPAIHEDATMADSNEDDVAALEAAAGGLQLDYSQFFPTTLPFHPHPPDVQDVVDPFDELCTSGVPQDLATTRDPQDNVAQRLCLDDLAAAETQTYLLQLPTQLPVQRPAIKEELKAGRKQAQHHAAQQSQARPASLAELPSGHLGKLLVFASGMVKLQIGEVLFDVNVGMPCLMRQDVAALNHTAGALVNMGRVDQRAVVSPNVWQLMSQDHPQEFKRADNCVVGSQQQQQQESGSKQAMHQQQQQQQQQQQRRPSENGTADGMDIDSPDRAQPKTASTATAAAAAAAAGGGPSLPGLTGAQPVLPGLQGGAAGASSSLPGATPLPSPSKLPATSARLDGLGMASSLPVAKSKLKMRPTLGPRKPAVKDEQR